MMSISLPAFPVEGGCVCGAIRYRLDGPPLSVYACHCLDCQCYSGSDYGLSMPVPRARFAVLRGRPRRFDKPADSGRVVGIFFCETCGTRLWHAPAHSPDLINVKPGTLDDPSWALPVAEVWAARRKPGVTIAVSRHSCDGQPTDRVPLYAAWTAACAPKAS